MNNKRKALIVILCLYFLFIFTLVAIYGKEVIDSAILGVSIVGLSLIQNVQK